MAAAAAGKAEVRARVEVAAEVRARVEEAARLPPPCLVFVSKVIKSVFNVLHAWLDVSSRGRAGAAPDTTSAAS